MKMKVLVVDDSKAMRMIVRRALRQTGLDLDVSEAENGQAAFHQLTETRFDFVLSDWNMPATSSRPTWSSPTPTRSPSCRWAG